MEPLYLVDGSGYIFRAFYAIAPLTNHAGLPTNALFGFTRMLTKLLRDVRAHYIAVAFDTGEPTFRHEMYTDYKANRDECPQDLVPQMPYFRRIVQAMGIPCLEKQGVEADDIIATIAERCSALGQDIVIVSGDKDLLQLVNDKIKVFDAMRDRTFDRAGVKEKLGVFPEQVCDYLALIGDSSDNVPGVKGIGPKTAERLLEHFGSLDKLVEKSSEIETLSGLRGAKSVRGKVESAGEELRLSHRLVCLLRDVEPYNRISDVNELAFSQVRSDLLVPLFDELEFSNLVSSLEFAGASAPAKTKAAELDKDFALVTREKFPDFVSSLREQKRFAFDTETSSLDVLDCELFGMSFSWKRGQGFYLPLGGESAKEVALDPVEVREALGPIFANPEIGKIGVNLKFDAGVLALHGYEVRGMKFDAMLASHLLHPDRRQNGLKFLAEQYLKEQMVTYEELVEDKENIGHVPLDLITKYASHDAEASWSLGEVLSTALGAPAENGGPSLRRAFDEIEMPLVPVLGRMERAGIKVDVPFLQALEAEFGGELKELERSIIEIAGKEFNINSPKQLSAVLFEDLGLPTAGVKKTQSGFSTDASVLTMLSETYPIAAKLLEYRELHKLNSTYVEALQRLVHPKTGRIHSSFNQAVAATGRLSSTEPNLQNIPIRNPRGRRLRQAFIAEAGSRLLAADYSQIELRVLAHLSGDKNLRAAFAAGEDIHTRTAKELFGGAMLGESELKDLRRVAKTINFGIVYGMGAFRLSNDLKVSRKQAQKYIDDYFARYPRVQEYFESLRAMIESRGYIETLFGRRRMIHEVDTTGRDAGYAERSLLNAPLQGTAAEIIKRAMIELDERLAVYRGKAKIVLQVHDELVLEITEDIFPEVEPLVVSTMETAVSLEVPLQVDVRSGTRWGE